MRDNHKAIAPSMIYAYAALKSGIPFANGAPNLTVDIPALMALADKNKLAICGKDFKTGQTLMKTIIAPGLKSRMLGLTAGTRQTFSATATVRCSTIRNLSRRKKSRSCPCSSTFFSPTFIRPFTKTSHTSSASTTIRRAATTKKAGTTSTSLAGSATRCRSRSTFSVATRSSRRRSFSTSRCSWISLSVRE